MNCDTGHLVTSNLMEKLLESGAVEKSKDAFINQFGNVFNNNPYTSVPDEFEHAAQCALDGKEEAHISMTSGGKLSKWAQGERKKKRMQQKESRRKNR